MEFYSSEFSPLPEFDLRESRPSLEFPESDAAPRLVM